MLLSTWRVSLQRNSALQSVFARKIQIWNRPEIARDSSPDDGQAAQGDCLGILEVYRLREGQRQMRMERAHGQSQRKRHYGA